MAFSTYHRTIRFTADGNTYDIKIDNLNIKAIPISLAGSTSVELFDGRKKQRIDGWRYEVELAFREIRTDPDDHLSIRNLMRDILNANKVTEVDFDLDNVGTKTLDNLVLAEGGDAISAIFNGGIRGRSLSFILESDQLYEGSTHPYSWIVS